MQIAFGPHSGKRNQADFPAECCLREDVGKNERNDSHSHMDPAFLIVESTDTVIIYEDKLGNTLYGEANAG